MATSLQDTILQTLDRDGSISDTKHVHQDQTEVAGVLRSLEARGMITFRQIDSESWLPTAEGQSFIDNGSHEAILFDHITKATAGLKIADVSSLMGANGKIGQQNGMKRKWFKINKETQTLEPLVDSVEDTTREQLKALQSGSLLEDASLAELKKRRLVEKQKSFTFAVEKGERFALQVVEEQADLTIDMVNSGAYKSLAFKSYNFAAAGANVRGGALHPLMKVREEFRQIFFELGFEEMATNNFVETSFWNFDSLFVPQQHPARDLQDTFYIKDPGTTTLMPDPEYVERVHKVHESGLYGSIGYRYPWKAIEAQKLVLRTHTTAVSAAMLYKLANQPGGFKPAKYFSIDRVFRNETVDATHLAEFHQVEGVIADRNLTLGDLIGFMERFFAKMGVHNLRFKPAYNPYTEPSMEIFSYHEGLKKWVEVGNSGMFRPEMLEPMGLPSDVKVHGWGLSLERPTMIKYGIDNIRELLGHKCSLEMIESNAAVRLDKGSISARG
ncbi:Phenylalanyl-tRNA synthetase, beta subunit, cytoplasmic [Savitreella phatthalungensis]